MPDSPALPKPEISPAEVGHFLAAPEPSSAKIAEALYNLATVLSEARGEGSDTGTVDRLVHAVIGRATQGISPAGLALAWLDWLIHLGMSPGKAAELEQTRSWKSLAIPPHGQDKPRATCLYRGPIGTRDDLPAKLRDGVR